MSNVTPGFCRTLAIADTITVAPPLPSCHETPSHGLIEQPRNLSHLPLPTLIPTNNPWQNHLTSSLTPPPRPSPRIFAPTSCSAKKLASPGTTPSRSPSPAARFPKPSRKPSLPHPAGRRTTRLNLRNGKSSSPTSARCRSTTKIATTDS